MIYTTPVWLFFLLRVEAYISGETTNVYFRHGGDAVLPCKGHADCSTIQWLYNRNRAHTATEIANGVVSSTSRADRLNLEDDCALLISDVSAGDAGLYSCGQTNPLVDTYLNILTISPSPPDPDGRVTLNCSLSRYKELVDPCQIHWVAEEAELRDGDDGYTSVGQKNCISTLIVNPQRGMKRTYHCQVIELGEVKVDADYTSVYPDSPLDAMPIYIAAAVGGIVILVILSVLIKCRNKVKVTESPQKTAHSSGDPDDSLTYVTLSHTEHNNAIPKKQKEVEELEVTYSTVRTSS
ncbi:uncharacterized protein LOC143004184 isoform X2 [Genypterus blacodes]|uniref:uncharacterized protein LOC143004184 isoform X2 n=1 Tax=Genypterus blacodes TaxID=154954 RepID=UPI003F76E0EA